MRMLAVFEKGSRIRHIGHLDLMRAMQRALRRSGLPIAYSKGFNPHVLVTFASALSAGASGLRELMDVTLEQAVEPETFLQRMNQALPPELQISEAKPLDDHHPALMASVRAAGYRLQIMEDAWQKLQGAEAGFLTQETIPAVRKTKSGLKECDIKPLIHSLRIQGDTIEACLALSESDTCKPDMLMSALCTWVQIPVPRWLTVRTQLFGVDQQGNLAPLEEL